MNNAIFGPPGSGKTTQAKLLAEKLNLNFLDSGTVLRASFDTEFGNKAKEYMDRGELVPDELQFQIVGDYVAKECDPNKGFVFTGFPRTFEQISFMENMFGGGFDKVFVLVVSKEEFLKRLAKRAILENRSDETPEAIEERLSEYNSKTTPVINYYREKGVVEEINGERSVEEIFEDILARV